MKKIILVLILCSMSFADKLVVDVSKSVPMVEYNGLAGSNGYSGFDIELWEALANDLNLEYEFNYVREFKNLFERIQDGKSDVAISGITITEQREKMLDFSHNYFRSRLAILVRNDGERNALDKAVSFFGAVKDVIPAIITFLIYTLMLGILIQRFELGNNMFSDVFWEGLFDGWYWVNVVVTTVGFGDKVPLSKRGKILTIACMWSGIFIVVPYVTATFTSRMTVDRLTTSYISNKEDLRSKKVAVKQYSTSAEAIKKIGAEPVYITDIDQGYNILKLSKVDAVVHDYPVVKHFARGKEDVLVIDDNFEEQDYGIALPEGSVLREPINRALLALKSSGKLKALHQKYFGELN